MVHDDVSCEASTDISIGCMRLVFLLRVRYIFPAKTTAPKTTRPIEITVSAAKPQYRLPDVTQSFSPSQ